MSEFVISSRYANALMSLADDNNSFERILQDINLVKNTLADSKELRNFLSNPIIASIKKLDVIEELFNSLIIKDVSNFLKFLVDKGREDLLFDVCKRFLALSDEKLNQVNVSVTSAVDLTQTQKEKVKSKLEDIINKKVIPIYELDQTLIGGFKARYGDTVIDASIHHQLIALKKKLFEQNYLKN